MAHASESPRRLGHLPALDGLRGVAVLLVLLRHLPEISPDAFSSLRWLRDVSEGGYLGVDVFFVLSGFLITSLLLEAFSERSPWTRVFRNFYGRRALRLLPAMVLLVLVFTVVSVLEGEKLGSLWPSVRSVLLYYNNWHSVWDSDSFTADLGHLWSLAIEEQFYIVWPLVLATVVAFSARLRTRLFLIGIPIVWVFWYRAQVWDTGVGWANVFVRTDTRIDAILVGCFCAVLYRHGRPKTGIVKWAGLAGVLVLAALVAGSSPLDGWMYRGGFTLAALAAGAVILAVAEGPGRLGRVLATKPLVGVGRVSYGLYLWHFPVFRFVGRHTETWATLPRVVVALSASFALTLASWFLVERIALARKERWFRSEASPRGETLRAAPPVSTQYFWRTVFSIGAGSVVTLALVNVWPRSSIPATDRMGYALLSNFPLNRYWQVTLLWVLLMPTIAVFVWSALPRLAGTLPALRALVGDTPLPRVDFDDREIANGPVGGSANSIARLALVGGTAGLLVATRLDPGTNGWWWLGLCTAAYVGLMVLVSRIVDRGRWRDISAALNLVMMSLLPLLLWWAARSTRLTRVDNGKQIEFDWLPFLPMVACALLLLAVDGVWLRRQGIGTVGPRERARLVFFVVPVLLFTWVSHLRGSTGDIDVFHYGESLNGGWLWATGRVPWRDFFFNVGFYPAVLAPRLALRQFGVSWWGLIAGTYMFLIPVLVVSLYLACAALVSRYWTALLAIVVLLAFPAEALGGFLRVLNGDPTLFVFRFSFMAPALIALLLFLRKPSWTRAVVFGLFVVTNVIMSSETIVFATAFCIIIFARDLVGWRRGSAVFAHFQPTIRGAAGMIVGMACAAAVLAWMGALGAYIEWWRIFPFRWYIETGTPIGLGTDIDAFEWGGEWVVFFAVPISVLCCIAFVIWRLRTRRDIRVEDWVAIALALGNLLFFQKALNRPDNHVYQSLITSIPLWFYMAVRGITAVAHAAKEKSPNHRGLVWRPNAWIGLALVLALFPFMPVADSLNDRMSAAPNRWKTVSAPPASLDRIGFTDDGAFAQTSAAVREFIARNLSDEAVVFDFANATGLYNFVLDKRPISRFSYPVQMSTRPAMREVISAMRQRSPEVVVFGWESTIDEWDQMPNSIRHFDLGEYILRNYSPWAVIGEKGYKQTLMLRNDLRPGYLMPNDATPAMTGEERRNKLFNLQACDWGYAASHLKVTPAEGVAIKAEPVLATVTAFGWAHTTSDDPVDIVVSARGREIFRGPTTPNRADLVERGVATGKNSGFYFDIPVTEAIASEEDISISRVASDGQLIALPRVAKQGVNDATGEFDVRLNQAIEGQVPIGGGTDRRFLMRLEFPSDRTDLSWLVVRSEFGFAETNFFLYDKALDPTRRIGFRAAPRDNVTGAMVGACPEWYAWDTTVLYLEFDRAVVGPEVFAALESSNR